MASTETMCGGSCFVAANRSGTCIRWECTPSLQLEFSLHAARRALASPLKGVPLSSRRATASNCLCQSTRFLKKNLNASRSSEHPPVRGKMSKRLGGIIGCRYKTSSWHLNGFPDGSNIDFLLENDIVVAASATLAASAPLHH